MALPNLPIPRELRDQIYGYLLDSAYTKVRKYPDGFDGTQHSFTRQGYKFHTEILAVNRTIHHEAEEYLYKNNYFIVASFDWPNFKQEQGIRAIGDMVWSRFVNAKHVVKMRHHTVRIHLAKNLNKSTSANVTSTGSSNAHLQSLLILAKDFEAFCTTIQFQLKASGSGFAMVIGDHDHDPVDILQVMGVSDADAKILKPPNLKIEFRDTPSHKRTAQWQRQLTVTISEVATPSMKVTVSGALRIEDSEYIKHLKAKMGPVLYSRCADSWVKFETLCKAKLSEDEAVDSGELRLAAHTYARIVTFARSPSNAPPGNEAVSRAANESIFGLLFDVLCTLGYLQIKLRDLKNLANATEYLRIWLDTELAAKPPGSPLRIPYPEGAEAQSRYLFIVGNMLVRDHPSRADRAIRPTMRVSRLLEIYYEPAFEGNLYAMHDLAILETVWDPDDPAFFHLPLHRCGAYKLPVSPVKFYLKDNVPTRPDYLVGLQNLDAIRRLSERTKARNNAIQRA